MFIQQSAPQKSGATGPLHGRGSAPVVATFQGRCQPDRAPPQHLSPFVTADLRFDIAAIRADAKLRYAAKLDFINEFDGAPKRRWQWAQARRAVERSWREAKYQLHNIVFDRLPSDLPFTKHERARMAQLQSTMDTSPVNARGNADCKAAAGELTQINWNAEQRAYFAIIAEAREETARTMRLERERETV